jgi:hypothetical protein
MASQYLDVAIVVLFFKHNHRVLFIPQRTTKLSQFGDPNPLLPPLPQVVVDLGTSHIIATEFLQCPSNLIEVNFLESFVSPHTS